MGLTNCIYGSSEGAKPKKSYRCLFKHKVECVSGVTENNEIIVNDFEDIVGEILRTSKHDTKLIFSEVPGSDAHVYSWKLTFTQDELTKLFENSIYYSTIVTEKEDYELWFEDEGKEIAENGIESGWVYIERTLFSNIELLLESMQNSVYTIWLRTDKIYGNPLSDKNKNNAIIGYHQHHIQTLKNKLNKILNRVVEQNLNQNEFNEFNVYKFSEDELVSFSLWAKNYVAYLTESPLDKATKEWLQTFYTTVKIFLKYQIENEYV